MKERIDGFFMSLCNKEVSVLLSDRSEYNGTLLSYDAYYNLYLIDCSRVYSTHTEVISNVIIRRNNIVYLERVSKKFNE